MSYTLVVAGLVAWGERPDGTPTYALTRRPDQVHLGGSWELPGGKIEPGETANAAIRRELAEELGVVVASAHPITFSAYRYPEKSVLLLFYDVTLTTDSPAPRPLEATELRLLTLEEILELDLPPANGPILARLASRVSSGSPHERG